MVFGKINSLYSIFSDIISYFNLDHFSKENNKEKNSTSSKIRLNKFDNLKGFGIILVVLLLRQFNFYYFILNIIF
ncbi:hypothetical protein MBCUT_11130 [Methanobrevibacter cuticularis]|uniref:Uncharacterized protein n=1 Tax=Methanobrevibacter cuticularis TaxID=47311 RepID=A0A166DWR4_9EURY|nr:hypothetical protein MBCUT_11130 [Methanobrevibacter cuticularis]